MQYALPEEELATTAPPTPGQAPADKSPSLTPREEEVATLVAQGLTNSQIASELFISERTVDHHVEKILKKLNLSSRKLVAFHLGHQ